MMELVKAEIGKYCKVIKARYDPMKDWIEDRIGHFLIRLNHDTKEIELGFCTDGNVIEMLITGKTAEEIYQTLGRQINIIKPAHMAYVGKELYKAELCLRYGKPYIQDQEISL